MMNLILVTAGIALMLFSLYDIFNVDYKSEIKVIWHLAKSYAMQTAVQLFIFLIGFDTVIINGNMPVWVIAFLLAAVFVLLLMIQVDAGILIHLIRGKGDKTAIRSDDHQENPAVWEGKYYLTFDVTFDSRYPNHFMDIYRSEKAVTEKKPIFIYAHGGGYVFGDKSNGDPNAMGISGIIRMFRMLLDAGFTVISTDYILAPEFRYPAPVLQMDELLHYLDTQQNELGIDMSRVVLGGGSAGGQLMAQTACIQTCSEYASEFGIEPFLNHGEIRAVYHGCALLDNGRFGETSSFAVNYIFYQMGRAYFHNTGFLSDNADVLQSNVIKHVTESYPPSYITDGNAGTFNCQAHDLKERLDELGVKNKALIFDGPDDEKLIHGFDTLECEKGIRSMKEMVEFVRMQVT